MFLEQDGIRYSLLIFGMLMVFQQTVQSMLHQLDSILEKAKDGLFLPVSDKEIVTQFTVIPVIVMICILGMITLILKSSIIQFFLAAVILSIITILFVLYAIKVQKAITKILFCNNYCNFSSVLFNILSIMKF